MIKHTKETINISYSLCFSSRSMKIILSEFQQQNADRNGIYLHSPEKSLNNSSNNAEEACFHHIGEIINIINKSHSCNHKHNFQLNIIIIVFRCLNFV